MRRNALARFFERLVVASLPLAVPACKSHSAPMPLTPGGGDLSAPAATGDLDGGSAEAADLAHGTGTIRDLAGVPPGADLWDPCDNTTNTTDPPPAIVPFPASDIPDGGFATPCQSGTFCNGYCPSVQYTTCCGPQMNASGGYELTCILNCAAPGPGRRPDGRAPAVADASGCDVGRYFAEAAHLEAASVHAFRRLGRELSAHDAPPSLVADARRALRDEVRHARLTRQLARAHGAAPPPVRVSPAAPRSLEAIAVENAVEGCVRETFAALLAVHQARAAADPEVRATMALIAPDETRHAELAWAVDRWLRTRLDRAARRRVKQARRSAVAALSAEATGLPPSLASALGLPDLPRTRALIEATRRELWS